jgi:hypothetical protein
MDEIPLCYMNSSVEEFTKIGCKPQFSGRNLTKDRVTEIMDLIWEPLMFVKNKQSILIGKGFLARLTDEGEMEVLFIATHPRIDIRNKSFDQEKIKLYINKKLLSVEFKHLLDPVKGYIEECIGDVVYTKDVLKNIGLKIDIPKFKTLTEKKEWEGSLISDTFEKIKTEMLSLGLKEPRCGTSRINRYIV